MVKVVFHAEGDKISLVAKGHAGQSTEGRDIVCSACSILAYTVAQIILCEAKNGAMKSNPVIRMEKGDAEILCEPVESMYNEILHTFYVAEVGYTLLAHDYPQNVELTVFGEPERA